MSRVFAAAALAALLACGCAAAQSAVTPTELARSSVSSRIQPAGAASTPAVEAAWCGSAAQADRAPNVVAGNPVHWVYVIPSDSADNFGAVAAAMQSDAEEIDSWWRGQDSTRVPRNDLTAFSCGTQLDITTVRSTQSGSQLTPLAGRFQSIVTTIERAGLSSTRTKYLAYYDGPVDDSNVCGQGGSDSTGFGVAIVYYRSCSGVSTAAVGAHEFLHTIGAVPPGAPHGCTGDAAGHTCDNEADLMYPSLGPGSLASTKVLDPGRDDYYGHPASFLDTQDSPWLVRLDSQTPFALTVSGTGTVSADVPGLQCATSCTTTWNAGQQLSLVATPGAGAKLVRWSGACTGAAGCTLTVNPGTAVSALFGPVAFRLTVAVSGRGAVRSSTAGIACRPRCTASLPSFSPVRLTATPAKGWKFRSWSGACRGKKTTCTVPMTTATSARARFVRA